MFSDYVCDQLLGWIKNTNFDATPSLYFGLNSADPSNTGANEVTDTYTSGRASYSGFDAIATIGNFRQTQNTNAVDWGSAIAAGSVTHYSVWDSATGGNFLFGGQLRNTLGSPQSIAFGIGDNVSIPIGGVIVSVSNDVASNYLADLLLGWLVLGVTPPTALTNVYVGLATSVIADGTIAEVTTTIRPSGRIALPSSSFGAIATVNNYRQTLYPNNIDFGNSAGTVTGLQFIVTHDASSAGNLLARINLAAAKNVALNEPIKISANALGFGIR